VPTDLEKIYVRLLGRNHQQELFGSLVEYSQHAQGAIASCPFHADSMPTLILYRDRPEYFCFVCGARGDWLQYLQNTKSLNFSKALEELSSASGIEIRDQQASIWRENLERTQFLESAHTFFTTQLWSAPGRETLHAVFSRGYGMEEVEGMALGFYPGPNETRDYLLSQGCPRDDVDALFSRVWISAAEAHRIVIPYRDSAGRLMGLMGMDISRRGSVAYAPITDMTPVLETPFLLYRCRGHEEVIVVEGFFDALLLDRIALKPVTGIGSDGLTTGHLETAAFFGIRHFILCLGNGPGKDRKTRDAIGRIRERGLEASVMPLPGKFGDIDEFIRSTCLDHFKKLLTRIESDHEWLRARNS